VSTQLSPPRAPAEAALNAIRDEIAVPRPVMKEAKDRRNLVLKLASGHRAARDTHVSGSVAHGTTNKPLEDVDCGVVINRRVEAFRAFGPDAPGGGRGPREFVEMFADYIAPRLRASGYPSAEADLGGNRAIKFEFNEPVEFDEWGEVDPYVDLIVALAKADGRGIWIPNLRRNGWDVGDPMHHTWVMTERDGRDVRLHRAHVLRLAKRAIKRDEQIEGRAKVMCSWNLSALALEGIDRPGALGEGLSRLLWYASEEIAQGLTEDPSPAIDEPIKLPDGITLSLAAARLREMADIVDAALSADSAAGAQAYLAALYGPEIEEIRGRESARIASAYDQRDAAALGTALGLPAAAKPSRSHGA
jgi:hypothetical protein